MYQETPEGMRQQISNLQQLNSLLIAQHERMEVLILRFEHVLPIEFVDLARNTGFDKPVSF